MAPHVLVDFHEPIEAFLLARQLVAFNHGDERLNVNPPKLLVPLELLKRSAQTIHEVEDAAVLLVPTVLSLAKGDVNGFVDKVLTTETLAEVHDEPHGFDGVTRIQEASLVAVHQLAVLAHMLHDEVEFGTIEDV